MTEAQIIGWAHSRFGRSDAEDVESLMAEVIPQALSHAEVGAEDIDGLYVGVYNNGFSRQGFEGALAGMAIPALASVPAVHLENACATGSAALHAGLDFLAAGRGRVALVIGAEKMTGVSSAEVGNVTLSACYRDEEAEVEGGFAGIFGQIADRYFQDNGDQSKALAMIAAKNHANGVLNPYAHMRRDFSVQFCNTISEKNPRLAGPLRRTDCSLISDGAVAIVLAVPEVAQDAPRAIRFRSRVQTNDVLALSRRDPTEFAGARRAWTQALDYSGIDLMDLDLVETHDCFTIAELLEYEAMGLMPRGQGARAIREGIVTRDGALPVNPSGGLKARGHPLGATGVSQHVMAAMQLMDEAVDMQLPDVNLAGVFNMGGAAVANYVSILERAK